MTLFYYDLLFGTLILSAVACLITFIRWSIEYKKEFPESFKNSK